MLINPFKKERRRQKLIRLLPVLGSKCEYLSGFFKENVSLVEVDEEISESLDEEIGAEILIVDEDVWDEFSKIVDDFEADKSTALDLLEDIRPYLLEDGFVKDTYAMCYNRLEEILEEYEKVTSFIEAYEVYTV